MRLLNISTVLRTRFKSLGECGRVCDEISCLNVDKAAAKKFVRPTVSFTLCLHSIEMLCNLEHPYTFQGWLALDSGVARGDLSYKEFEPKAWTERDVDIAVTHCGMCGTDIHTLHGAFGTTTVPCCVGHEIVGTVVKAGSESGHTVGTRVGVGPQSGSCDQEHCLDCSRGRQNYCKEATMTYNGKYKDGSTSQGGFASHCRVPGTWAFRLPEGLSSAYAAPMLCAGLTVYSPLVRTGMGPGKTVGVVGLGGLGHFAVIFAKAMGCEVTVISRSNKKAKDAIDMGADVYIATQEDPTWAQTTEGSLDLILDTAGSVEDIPQFLQTLRAQGEIICLGAPRSAEAKFNPWLLVGRGIKCGGSIMGSRDEIEQMLQFAMDHDIKPWVEERPMQEINSAISDFLAGKPRYRYVMVHGDLKGPDKNPVA